MAFQLRGKSEGSSILVLWLAFSCQPWAEFSKEHLQMVNLFIRFTESQADNLGCI